MAKVKYEMVDPNLASSILSEAKSIYGLKTYISLFSSAGVGCYGFKKEGFYCIATVELLERRLKIQSYNHKCVYKSGYICGDMTLQETKDKVFKELALWKRGYNITDLDVLVATPPCQGMSVANHKKKDELKRNSLVVESIKMTMQIKPKFFIYENVRAFLNSVCTDIDGQDITIKEAIDKAKEELSDIGRIVVRPSGTEPKLRVMVECEDKKIMKKVAEEVADVVKKELGSK